MMKVALIPWNGAAAAVDAFCEHFRANPAECLAYGHVALAVDQVQLAAVAARAYVRIGNPSQAEELVSAVCERALFLGVKYELAADSQTAADCRKAAFVAADGDQRLLDRSAARNEERSQHAEPADRERNDGAPSTPNGENGEYFKQFETLVANGTHSDAALLAETLRSQLTGRSRKMLFSSVRQLGYALLDEGKFDAATEYLFVLSRMLEGPEQRIALHRKLLRALSAALTDALWEEEDLDKVHALALALDQVESAHPLALRAEALVHARKGNADQSLARLDALYEVAPSDVRWVLQDARRSRQAGVNGAAAILYGWLLRFDHAEAEAERVRNRIRVERLQHLRSLHDAPSEAVLAAAEAVLELDPREQGALLAGAEALVQMNANARALSMLNMVLTLDPAHEAALRLIAPL